MEVRVSGLHDIDAWDGFARDNGASVFHSHSWGDVIEHTFNYKRIYLLAEEESKVEGILPLFYLKKIFTPKRLVSLPVSDLGGPVGTPNAVSELIESAQQLMVDLSCEFIELKGPIIEKDYFVGEKYSTFLLDVPDSEDDLLKVIGKKNRNLVRKAIKNGVKIEQCTDLSDVAFFWDVYAETMKQLGTPPYPKSFYENILKFMVKGGRASILLAKKEDVVLGGAIFLRFGETMYYLAGVTPHRNQNLSPNNLLVYTGLKIAQKSGLKTFDFGRTRREGVFNFKKSWGGTPKELPYYYKALNPDKKVSSSKITSLAPLWRKLIPLPASKILGPPLRAHFGF